MSTTHIRWLNRTAVLMLAVTVLAISLIASGLFDPSPFGQSLWREELPQMTVVPASRQISWMNNDMPSPPFTARLTAAHKSGEADSGYGLILGSEERYLAVAVSPLGYLAIWETATSDSYHLNWQTWPHVNRGTETNEIWLDVDGDQARVRINREWLWEGEIDIQIYGIGILGESFGEETVIDFESVEMFANSSE